MANHDVIPAGYARLLVLEAAVRKTRSERLTDGVIKRELEDLHTWYLDELRPLLQSTHSQTEGLSRLDDDFESVILCATGRVRTTAGKKLLKKIRLALDDVTQHLAPHPIGATEMELKLIEVLRGILPTAAAGYEQALRDLTVARLSYRGVASELREVLREVLDHFARDDKVPKTPDGRRPTMKAKVRHILRVRDMGDTRRATAEATAEILDEGIPNLARSIYDLGSLDTHVSATKKEVARLRRYLEALLLDLIPLPH